MRAKPRTPVHFPRMKVRGRRNRAKLAARHTFVTVIPYARPERTPTGWTFLAIPDAEPGSVRLEFTTITDGFGRTIIRMPSVEPTPKPKTFTIPFAMKKTGDADALRALLTGGERDPLVQG